MRDHLVLYINGARQVVRRRDAFLSLSDFLRTRRGLISTKIVCSEGDCGACTVLLGRPEKRKAESETRPETNGAKSSPSAFPPPPSTFRYLPVDSCIQFMFQLDGAHIVTAEGLRPDGALNRVQQAMIDCHGSQCGFCTPGFVMAMTGLLEETEALDEQGLRTGLTGNLCRCTGYTPILEAGLKACDANGDSESERLNSLYPPAAMLTDLGALADDDLEITDDSAAQFGRGASRVACPATLDAALAFLAANPTATIVAGATDIGVRANKARRLPPTILDLNRIPDLAAVEVTDQEIRAGARATWTQILAACNSAVTDFARILRLFGAPQIRHVGTIGGNIANASPIADSLPFLFVMEAVLTLASQTGRREVNINNFYHGYKQLELKPGELITEVHIPLLQPDDMLRLYKVSRRRDLDIAGFTAAIRLRVENPPPSKGGARRGIEWSENGSKADIITDARIALGAVGPTVLRARRTEQFLVGKLLTEETMQAAGDVVTSEITPISDVRGAADYRRQLARNVLLKFYHQTQADLAPV